MIHRFILLALASLVLASPASAGREDAFNLSQHRGRVLLVNFWATWCAPCRAEMPALDNFYLQHRAEGLDMLVISMDDPSRARAAREFAARFHFEDVMAADVAIPGSFRPSALPMTLIFDRNGQLRFDSRANPGLMTEATLERLVTPLLAGK